MNRRDFIKALGAIPALVFLKPEVPEIEVIESREEGVNLYDGGEIRVLPTGEYTNLTQWNGLAFGPDDTIYVGGTFVTPGPVTNDEYWARWNGQEWERLDTIEGERVDDFGGGSVIQAQAST